MKISIIIPVYNAKKYLKKCIESVIEQSYRNLEIILVNDGSLDNSGKICDEYRSKDNRIKVIHQQNKGVSSARNEGIKESTSKYIMFIDSDDYIKYNAVEVLINTMIEKQSDLVVCGYSTDTGQDFSFNHIHLEAKKNIYKFLLDNYSAALMNSTCNKLYKKELISELFNENISLGEDLLFNIKYFQNINSLTCLGENLYFYRRGNINSLSQSFFHNLFDISKMLHNSLTTFFNECNLEQVDFNKINFQLLKNTISYIYGLVNSPEYTLTNKIKKIGGVCNDYTLRKSVSNLKNISLKYNMIRILVKYKMVILIIILFRLRYLQKIR